MLHDPADETHRKPRQLRNTPLQKYVRLASLGITLLYAGAMYISWRRNVVPLLNDENVIKEFSREERDMLQLEDYVTVPFAKDTIQKLVDKETKSKAETESEDTQAKVE